MWGRVNKRKYGNLVFTFQEVPPTTLDCEAPYLLFYEQRDLRTIDYMPDVHELTAHDSSEDDDFDKEVKKYCTIM